MHNYEGYDLEFYANVNPPNHVPKSFVQESAQISAPDFIMVFFPPLTRVQELILSPALAVR
jgi:hypothetical protein